MKFKIRSFKKNSLENQNGFGRLDLADDVSDESRLLEVDSGESMMSLLARVGWKSAQLC